MGIARLSHNWLVNTLASVYVEVVRNIPLLLQLLLVYAIIIHALPQARESASLFGMVLLNTGGLLPAAAGDAARHRPVRRRVRPGPAGDPVRAALGRPQARAHRASRSIPWASSWGSWR